MSPYGVRGLGGNVRDLCLNRYRRTGPPIVAARAPDDRPTADDFVVVKGGSYPSVANFCRASARFGVPRGDALATVGFRLVRPVISDDTYCGASVPT